MRALNGRIAVVTGAAGGIGRALSREFARAGMHIVLADVDEAGMAASAAELRALGRRALCVPTDVRELAQVEHLLERTLSELGGCHVVLNNAGVFHAASLLDTEARHWQRVIDVNLWGVIHGCRVFGRHFRAAREGHIVNTASAAGLLPTPGMSAYSTSKFAVVGLTRQLRWELAGDGVGVTLLVPGVVNTGIARNAEVGLAHLDIDALMRGTAAPERLARRALRAVERNQAHVLYGTEAYAFKLAALLPTWLSDRLGPKFASTALRVVRGEIPPPFIRP